MNELSLKKIAVQNISKHFRIGFHKNDNALSRLLSLILGRESKKPITVLEDISLEVFSGENVGIIGNNGSGKSTLLRTIAGIYYPDQGQIETQGNIIYINGFGLGLKKRLSMRDNIYLMGSIMGLSHKETKKRFKDIVTFAELEDFIDTKVYQFSYGMLNRLCFSTTIHFLEQKNLDILLLDEVFGSGGDLSFQNKAIAKIEEFIKGGAAVILVSHDLSIIAKYCDRVILLENGKVKKEGTPKEIINEYISQSA